MTATTAGQYVCLTTLEYAVRGSLMSTHCPSCGLRLIIKHDNLVNRVTSVSLLLGMSLLIGYHMGAHGHWIHRLSNRVARVFGFGGDDADRGPGRPKGPNDANNNRAKQYMSNGRYANGYHHSNGMTLASSADEMFMDDEMETRMSDLTCDSAIDVRYGSAMNEDDIDEQLIELLAYNNLYSDYYEDKINSIDALPNPQVDEEDEDESRKKYRTRTVDRIDQVLHQIDDIKKSIVEIDDELYHIAGSTYANFNPDFLTLTNPVDEFERDDELFESTPNRKISEDRSSQTKVHLEEVSRKLASSKESGQLDGKRKERYSSGNDGGLVKSDSQSHASLSDMDSLQLEWDFDFESGYEYYDSQTVSQSESKENKNSLKEKTISTTNGLDMPMTDEQKLNMHALLDEAKKYPGLLNNIMDALAPSEIIQHHKQHTSKS